MATKTSPWIFADSTERDAETAPRTGDLCILLSDFSKYYYSGSTWVRNDTPNLGTALGAGDFTLSAGWGTTASFTSITGTDSRFIIEVTSAGTGQATNPTITLTYADGPWPSAPFPQITDNGSVDVGGGFIAPVFELTSTTTTTAVWTLRSSGPGISYTPIAGDVFKMIVVVVG